MANSSRNSRSMSLPYIKSQVSGFLEKQSKEKNKCGFASWLTIPQIIVKAFELIMSVIVISLLFSWESKEVKITDLDHGEYNFRNEIFYFVGVACVTVLYAIVITTLGIARVKIPPKALTLFAGVFLFLWLLAAPIMSATFHVLNDSVFVRMFDLDTLYIRVAVIFGFVLLVLFVGDILLGFLALRKLSTSEEFQSEVKHSRSVLAAAKISAHNTRRRSSVVR